MTKRVFLLVMDSFGAGELPDAPLYGDAGSNTLKTVASSPKFDAPTLTQLGLFNFDGAEGKPPYPAPIGSFGKAAEQSKGKDTTTGHWEIAGLISEEAMPTFPNGFPDDLIVEYEKRTGRKVLCNKPYSGTKLLTDFGLEHVKTGALLVYTSADSVFQVAAHEEVVPLEELYEDCRIARELLTGPYAVGRVIARPFIGSYPNFTRTANRHDFSLNPFAPTMLDCIEQAGLDSIAVGKIHDIFAGCGITRSLHTVNNADGMEKTLSIAKEDFHGLCFVNLVDFDMTYGHRNDIDGYAGAVSAFDRQLKTLLGELREEDLLLITADHGCDPGTASTDHSREYVPVLAYGKTLRQGVNLGVLASYADIGATVLDYLNVPGQIAGSSFLPKMMGGR